MLGSLLSEDLEALLRSERRWLLELRSLLVQLGAGPGILDPLDESSEQLDQLFLLVVVGEFNSGKSSLLNALLGSSVLPEGVTPTTQRVHLLKYSEHPEQLDGPGGIQIIGQPVDLLRRLHLVDTPGTNAVIREHEILTERYVPRADLILFVTSADRPFSESERAFLERIREWGKKVVLVVNKVDLLETADETEEVESFVRARATELLELEPPLFLLSARSALRASAEGGAPADLAGLESYVRDTLDETQRLRLKFLNPLGVGRRFLAEARAENERQRQILAEDFQAVDDLEGQMQIYREDMESSFRLRLAEIENVLFAMEKRGRTFFDRNLRLARFVDLFDRARLQREFEAEVVADTPQTVERKVLELAEWIVRSDLKQWQSVSGHLEERTREHRDRIVGGVGGGFHDDRHHVIASVRGGAQRVVDGYDRAAEARDIADGARRAVAGSAALEVGAIGLGALVASLATTAAVDITGIVAAGVLATVGLLVIPARRRTAKRELGDKVAGLRSDLMGALSESFEGELSRSMDRLSDTVAPYSRFVRSEQRKLEETHRLLLESEEAAEGLQREIETI